MPQQFQRKTLQREIILDELMRLGSHPTADELYQQVRRRLPRISLGTVYRNLESLAAQGVIRKLEGVGSQRRFDGNAGFHAHFLCTACGSIEDVMLPLSFFTRPIEGMQEFDIRGARVELTGICPRCRESQETNISETASEADAENPRPHRSS